MISNLNLGLKTSLFQVVFLLMTIVSLELLFMFIPRSHGVGYTYASRYWFHKYWGELNEQGFRESEKEINDNTVLFVGDSFTAGHGTKKREDRFSDIFDAKSDKYNSINIGQNGSDTDQEYKAMNDFLETKGKLPNKIGLAFVKGSFLVNYLYWLHPHGSSEPYINFLKDSYENENVFKAHTESLNKFILFSENNNIEIIVIIYPFLGSLEMSDELYVDKINSFFNARNVSTINVSALVKGMPSKELVVNEHDGHGSEKG